MPLPSTQFSRGHERRSAIVIHTMAGTLRGSDSWFKNNPNQTSAHYGVGLDGEIHQYVSLDDSAHANGVMERGNVWQEHFGADWANDETISVETEDLNNANQVVTIAQYQSVLQVCRLSLKASPEIRTLATHRSISPSSRAHCPGDRWIRSGHFAQLGRDLGLGLLL